jgi:triacylglycerol lipase
MNVLGLSGGSQTPSPPATASPELEMEEALASGGRLWVRGRYRDSSLPKDQPHWWERKPKLEPGPVAQLETRIGGQDAHAEVTLDPSGAFDATFAMDLPEARRGWRLARNYFAIAGKNLNKCAVVVTPPENVTNAVAVLLPFHCTLPLHGARELQHDSLAQRWTQQLQRWQHRPEGPRSFYYLGCVPAGEPSRQAELALAATALGWPSGSLILLPATTENALDRLAGGIDRLRWLLGEPFNLSIVNLEPSINLSLAAHLKTDAGRSPVTVVQQPDQVLSATPSLRPTRATRVLRHPVVFCHGLLAFTTFHLQMPDNHNYFAPLAEFLKERGYRALYPQVFPLGSVAKRAAQLREQINAWTSEPVNIIAHSMGGLDARYMITHLGMADCVRSLTTIAAPHRGTVLADWFMTNFQKRVPLVRALEALGATVAGFADCCPAACAEFNKKTPDSPEVTYFSYGGEVSFARVSPMLRRAWNMLTALEGANDGMISVASSKWGEYLGTIHVDHFTQTPDLMFVRPGEDFDVLGFYCRLLEDLARRGF